MDSNYFEQFEQIKKDNNINDIKELFNKIYDKEEYKDISLYLLDILTIDYLSLDMINNLLYKTKYGVEIIINNLNYLLNKNDIIANNIIVYLLTNYKTNKDVVLDISNDNNLHIRYLLITNLLKYYNNLINDIYPNIIDYLLVDDKVMDLDELCDIAILFNDNDDYNNYEQVKNYIIDNYKYNYLASKLSNKGNKKELLRDIDTYFKTSIDYRFCIYESYKDYISNQLKEDFERKIKFFKNNSIINKIYSEKLGIKLEEYIDKYLSLSNNDDYKYLGGGSTTNVYKIGDYVFKLSNFKWSYEDVICPNLYLIAKNYEEDYVRDDKNQVKCAIEVQKYFEKDTKKLHSDYFDNFRFELEKLGYYVLDRLIDNTRILDSYLDADTNDFKILPEWFKHTPIVLVDRDRVFKNGGNPKIITKRK